MTDYSRGYAAGLKAAAEVCYHSARQHWQDYEQGEIACSCDSAAGVSEGYEMAADKILSLPIEGEAEGSGPCVVVPVDQLEWLAAAAAREEHSQHLRNEGLRISAESVDAVDREEHDAHP